MDIRSKIMRDVRGLWLVLAMLSVGMVVAGCGDDNPGRVNVNNEPEPTPEPEPVPEPEPDEPDGDDGPPDIPIIDDDDTGGFEPACSLEDTFAPNQSAEEAADVGTNIDRDGLYVCSGANDWYRFDLEAGQSVLIFVEFQARFGDLDIYLYDEGRTGRNEAIAESTSPNQSEFINFATDTGGTFFLEIEGFDGSENQYRLFLNLGCNNDGDCPEGRDCNLRFGFCSEPEALDCGVDEDLEPNESARTATELEVGPEATVLTEVNICPEDADYYAVSVPEQAGLEIGLEHPGNQDLDVLLFNAEGDFFGQGNERRGGEDLLGLFLPPGDYIILVDQNGIQGSSPTTYDLSVRLQVGACLSDIECAGVPGREFCNPDSGICEALVSDGGQQYGEPCDDDADCSEDTAGCYEGSQGSGDNICTVLCEEDDECSDLSENAYCLVLDNVGPFAICVHGCEDDFDCSAQFFCSQDSGRCESRACNVDDQCAREGDSCLHADFTQGGLCRDYEGAQDHDCGVGEAPDEGDNGSSSRAALIEVEDGGGFFENLSLCDADEDWYVIEIDAEATNLTADVDYSGTGDLDVYIFNEAGRQVGAGTEPDANPEQALATFLDAGRYFIRVNKFPTQNGDDEVTYTLSINLGPIDCRIEDEGCDDTRPLRLTCDEQTGACVDFQGNGEVPLGENCDTTDDCVEAADFCFTFQGTQDNRNICSHFCTSGQECNDVPGTQCVPIRQGVGICIRR